MTPDEILARATHSPVAQGLVDEFGTDGLATLKQDVHLVTATAQQSIQLLLAHHPFLAAAVTGALHALADAVVRDQQGEL